MYTYVWVCVFFIFPLLHAYFVIYTYEYAIPILQFANLNDRTTLAYELHESLT